MKRIQEMDDKGNCLMTVEKNKIVGWWRCRNKRDNVIVANDRSAMYAFYLIIAIFPLGKQFGTPSLEDLFDIIKNTGFFDAFCTMFGYFMLLCYGSVLNLSVSCIRANLREFCCFVILTVLHLFSGRCRQCRAREVHEEC